MRDGKEENNETISLSCKDSLHTNTNIYLCVNGFLKKKILVKISGRWRSFQNKNDRYFYLVCDVPINEGFTRINVQSDGKLL